MNQPELKKEWLPTCNTGWAFSVDADVNIPFLDIKNPSPDPSYPPIGIIVENNQYNADVEASFIYYGNIQLDPCPGCGFAHNCGGSNFQHAIAARVSEETTDWTAALAIHQEEALSQRLREIQDEIIASWALRGLVTRG